MPSKSLRRKRNQLLASPAIVDTWKPWQSADPTSLLVILNAEAIDRPQWELESFLKTSLKSLERVYYHADSITQAVLLFASTRDAIEAKGALEAEPCSFYGGRYLFAEFLVEHFRTVISMPVCASKEVIVDYTGVPGLLYVADFISEEEEQALLHSIAEIPEHEWNVVKLRKVVCSIIRKFPD